MLAHGTLSLPIPTPDQEFPIIQYADDIVIFFTARWEELATLKNMLLTFEQSTGLKVNFSNSSMILLNIDEGEANRLTALLGCKIGQLPFTYLGLPLGTTRPRIVDFMPLVDALERRLTASSCMLNQGSQLQLLTSVLTSMHIYFLYSLQLPPGIIKQLDRISRQCLWRGNSDAPKQSLAAWDLVCRPKKFGGLGVTHLGFQNEALLMKHLFKFFNKQDIPWVNLIWRTYYGPLAPQVTQSCRSFWWRDVLSLYDKFCKLATPQVHAGDTVVFWLDHWKVDNCTTLLKERFPRLHSFVIDDLITVRDIFNMTTESGNLHLPLSVEAFNELQQLQSLLAPINLDPEGKDIWKWPSKSGDFQSRLFYDLNFHHLVVDPILKWIWKCSCTLKLKVFGCLLLMDRLNTRDMMQHRHWNIQDDICVMCHISNHEDRVHLFFACNFSHCVWNYLGISWIAQPNQ